MLSDVNYLSLISSGSETVYTAGKFQKVKRIKYYAAFLKIFILSLQDVYDEITKTRFYHLRKNQKLRCKKILIRSTN